MKVKHKIYELKRIDNRGNQNDFILIAGRHPEGKFDLNKEFETREDAEAYLAQIINYLTHTAVIIKVYKP